MSKNDGWEDVTHELTQPKSNDGWEDVSHELPKKDEPDFIEDLKNPMSALTFGAYPLLRQLGVGKFDEETAMRNAGDIGTLGYADNIRAAAEPYAAKLYNSFKPEDEQIQVEPDYVKRRDLENKHTEKLNEENPGSALIGKGAGMVLSTAAMPFMGAAKGANALTRIATSAATGGIMGAAMNPGEEEGKISGSQLEDRAWNAAKGAGIGFGLQSAGEVASKGFDAAKRGAQFIKDAIKQKMNASEIKEAAKALGIEITPGMLNETGGHVQRLEQSLSESPSMWGKQVNKARGNVFDKTNQTADNLLSDSTELSPYQIGEKVKSGITAKVGERQAPISMVFDDVAQSTKNIPLSERSVEAFKRNIKNSDGFKLLGETGKGKFYLNALDNLENANDVKTLMTMLNKDIRASEGSEQMVLSTIKDKLGNLEKNSITRAAIQSAKNSGEGQQAALDIIGDLKNARGDWRSMMTDLGDVSKNTRLGNVSSPDSFLNNIEKVPSERIQDKLFNINDKRALDSVSNQFPEEFGLLKQGKLRDLSDASQLNGGTNANRFLREAGKIEPEGLQTLFGNNTEQIGNLKTVTDAIPKNFNPSGTASQSMWNKEALTSNLTDIPRYMAYKGLANGSAEGLANQLIKSSAKFSEMSQKSPQAFSQLVERLALNPKFQSNPNGSKPNQQQQSPMMDRLSEDPNGADFVSNEKLKQQIKQRQLKQGVSQKAAQNQFVEEN
jgi:hypothetical protein